MWGFKCRSCIEQVHDQFCKEFLGVNQSVNNAVAFGECGRLPIAVSYLVKLIKYWLRLIEMDNKRYPKSCYNILKTLNDSGRVNWTSKVREFLFSDGLGIVWISQEVGIYHFHFRYIIKKTKSTKFISILYQPRQVLRCKLGATDSTVCFSSGLHRCRAYWGILGIR